jgi:hypothetical protein
LQGGHPCQSLRVPAAGLAPGTGVAIGINVAVCAERSSFCKERHWNLMTSRAAFSLLLLSAGLGACATVGQPQNAEAQAAAIRSAEEVGAARVPEAALRLQLAKDQLERARTMTSEEQRPEAARMLMRSQADAELALALARSSTARAEADKAKERASSVRDTGAR